MSEPKIVRCHKCDQVGHFAKHCKEEPKKDGGQGDGKKKEYGPSTCYVCGEEGHYSRTCPTRASKSQKAADAKKVMRGKPLPEELLSYMRYVARLIEENTFADDDDKSLFVTNVLKEMKGQEKALASNPETTKVLESVIKLGGPVHVRRLLNRFSGHFVEIARDRRSSHVLETCWAKLPPWTEDDDDNVDNAPPSTADIYTMVCEDMNAVWPDLLCDMSACHVMRNFLCVVAGVELPQEMRGSHKKKRPVKLSEMARHTVPKELRKVLRTVARHVDAGHPGLELANLTVHAYASPTLQLLCRLLALGGSRDRAACEDLLRRLTLLDGSTDEETKDQHIRGLMEHEVGSHFLQCALEAGAETIYPELYRGYLEGELVAHCENGTANYVIQHAIAHCPSSELFDSILDELLPAVSDFLNGSRGGVVVKLAEAATSLEVGQKRVFKAIREFSRLKSEEKSAFVTSLLGDEATHVYMPGALLLQQLMKFEAPKCISALTTSFMALPPAYVVGLSCGPVGCYVVEAFASAELIPLEGRMSVVENVVDHLAKMACDKYGSRVVERFFKASDIDRKELIAGALAKEEDMLASSNIGNYALLTCKVDHFKRKRDTWVANMKKNKKKKQMFDDLTGGKSSKEPRRKRKREEVDEDEDEATAPAEGSQQRKKKKKKKRTDKMDDTMEALLGAVRAAK